MAEVTKPADATVVFRIPENDVTTPDMMRNTQVATPVLTIIKGPQSGNTFVLDGAETTIGRDPANSIFLNDMTVSRAHAKILNDEKGIRIEDLGSLNGTWVDGAIINSAPLHDGSSIQVGTFTLVYHEHSTERIEAGE